MYVAHLARHSYITKPIYSLIVSSPATHVSLIFCPQMYTPAVMLCDHRKVIVKIQGIRLLDMRFAHEQSC